MNQQRECTDIGLNYSLILVLLLISLLTPPVIAADTMFRANPQRTGFFDNGGIVLTNTELWQFKTGDKVHSSPVVSNGIVYVGSYDGYLYALDAVTATEKWRFRTGNYITSSPAVSNGIVYIGSEDGNLYAIDAVTGEESWRFMTALTITSSPAVSNGIVYVGSYDGSLYAVDAVTGTEKWRSKTGDSVYSSPAVSNGVVYVGSYDQYIYTFDAVMGTQKWWFKTGAPVYSSPAVSNGVVYIGSHDGNLYAINAVTGKEKWRFVTGNYVTSSPAVSNGIVYVGSEDHNLYAIDAVKGTEKWRFATENKVYSSPAVSNGVIYVGGEDHNLYAIDAITGKEKWRFKTGGSVDSSPAVSNNVVYFGSFDGNLYAIGGATSTPLSDITISTTSPTNELSSSPSSSPDPFNPLIIISIILLVCIGGGGGYYVFHSRNSRSTSSRGQERVIETAVPDPILARIASVEKNAQTLTVFRTPVDNLLSVSRDYYSKGMQTKAETVLKNAEAAIYPLINCESQLLQWKNQGYDTSSLETVRTSGLHKINSEFQKFQENINKLERVRADLDELKRNYPSIVTQPEFRSGITSVEHYLKQPENVTKAQSEFEHLSYNIRQALGLVFISAKSEDYQYADLVYNFLIKKGYNVFFSKESLPKLGKAGFGSEIDSALEKAQHIIVVTSNKEHVESKWVASEWRMFLDEKRAGRKPGNIITILAGSMRIEDLPIGLRNYETKFLDNPETLEQILNYLK